MPTIIIINYIVLIKFELYSKFAIQDAIKNVSVKYIIHPLLKLHPVNCAKINFAQHNNISNTIFKHKI